MAETHARSFSLPRAPAPNNEQELASGAFKPSKSLTPAAGAGRIVFDGQEYSTSIGARGGEFILLNLERHRLPNGKPFTQKKKYMACLAACASKWGMELRRL